MRKITSVNLTNIRKKSIIIGVFITILSQMPLLRIKYGIDTQTLSIPIWIFIFLLSILSKNKIYINGIKIPLIFAFSFVFGVFTLQLITNNSYIGSVMTNPIIISIIMIIIGYINYELLEELYMRKVALAYIYATIIFCIDIYLNYFKNYNLTTIDYVFRAKNSLGQMVVTALILLLYMYNPSSNIKKFLKLFFSMFFIYMLVMMRSRASLISLLLIPFIYVFSKNIKIKYKVFCLLFVIVIGISILFCEDLFNLLVKNILFNTKLDGSLKYIDLNKLTSNRYDYLTVFPNLIKGNLLVGIGNYYMDNFYFASILNYGIILGVLVIIFALFPIKVAFFNKTDSSKFNIVFRTITLIYVFNSIFECLAPFGPGTKCFFMWLLLGAVLSIKMNKFKKLK